MLGFPPSTGVTGSRGADRGGPGWWCATVIDPFRSGPSHLPDIVSPFHRLHLTSFVPRHAQTNAPSSGGCYWGGCLLSTWRFGPPIGFGLNEKAHPAGMCALFSQLRITPTLASCRRSSDGHGTRHTTDVDGHVHNPTGSSGIGHRLSPMRTWRMTGRHRMGLAPSGEAEEARPPRVLMLCMAKRAKLLVLCEKNRTRRSFIGCMMATRHEGGGCWLR